MISLNLHDQPAPHETQATPPVRVVLLMAFLSFLHRFSFSRALGNLLGNSKDLERQIVALTRERDEARAQARYNDLERKLLTDRLMELLTGKTLYAEPEPGAKVSATSEKPPVDADEKWRRDDEEATASELFSQAVVDPEAYAYLESIADSTPEAEELLRQVNAEIELRRLIAEADQETESQDE